MRPPIDNAPVPLVGAGARQDPKAVKLSIGAGPLKKYVNPETGEFAFRILRSGAKADKGNLPLHTEYNNALVEFYRHRQLEAARAELGRAEAFRDSVSEEEDLEVADRLLRDANTALTAARKVMLLPRDKVYPTFAPIYVLSDEFSDVVFAERAAFWGSRPFCRCGEKQGGFWLKTRKEAKEDDLPWAPTWPAKPGDPGWPPPDIENNETYRQGLAERVEAWGPQKHTVEQDVRNGRLRCDPSSCPYATGQGHGVKTPTHDYAGEALCKFHIVMHCKLRLPGEPYGYATSTGGNTWRVFGTTWRDIQAITGGVMATVPMLLAVGRETRTPRRSKKAQPIPIMRFELDCSPEDARGIAKQITGDIDTVRARLAGERQAFGYLPGDSTYLAETAAEFSPKAYLGKPAWQTDAEAMMTALGWSGGQQDAELTPVFDEKMKPEALLARLRELVEQENGGDADGPPEAVARFDEAEGPVAEEGGAGDDVVHEAIPEPEPDVDDDAQDEQPPPDDPENPFEEDECLTQDDLTQFALEHKLTKSQIAASIKFADQLGFKKKNPKHRAAIMSELRGWAKRNEQGEEQPTLPVEDEGEE